MELMPSNESTLIVSLLFNSSFVVSSNATLNIIIVSNIDRTINIQPTPFTFFTLVAIPYKNQGEFASLHGEKAYH
jgi:hypothetical protein